MKFCIALRKCFFFVCQSDGKCHIIISSLLQYIVLPPGAGREGR